MQLHVEAIAVVADGDEAGGLVDADVDVAHVMHGGSGVARRLLSEADEVVARVAHHLVEDFGEAGHVRDLAFHGLHAVIVDDERDGRFGLDRSHVHPRPRENVRPEVFFLVFFFEVCHVCPGSGQKMHRAVKSKFDDQ